MVFVEAITVGCFPNYTLVHGNWKIFTRALLFCIKIMFEIKAFFFRNCFFEVVTGFCTYTEL